MLKAAAELVAESGWGRVTTRGIAERAGLPHGAVSYHFSGKQALLVEAALSAARSMFPADESSTIQSLDDLLDQVAAAVSGAGPGAGVGAGVLVEAMHESARDADLRRQLADLVRNYRRLVAGIANSASGVRGRGISPDAAATFLVAFCDGLWLHTLLEPTLDAAGALDVVRSMLTEAPVPDAP